MRSMHETRRRGRHREQTSYRTLAARLLFSMLALDVLLTPMSGGSAPGPRVITVIGLLVAAFYWKPGRRATPVLRSLFTGATALSVTGMGLSFDMAFSEHSEAWLNSATLWTCAAAVCGLCAWRYEDLRSRSARDDLVAAVVAALGGETGRRVG